MRSEADRFFEKVAAGPDGCIAWTGGKSEGYGRFCVSGSNVYAHRWSYEFHIGPIPEGRVVAKSLLEGQGCKA